MEVVDTILCASVSTLSFAEFHKTHSHQQNIQAISSNEFNLNRTKI